MLLGASSRGLVAGFLVDTRNEFRMTVETVVEGQYLGVWTCAVGGVI